MKDMDFVAAIGDIDDDLIEAAINMRLWDKDTENMEPAPEKQRMNVLWEDLTPSSLSVEKKKRRALVPVFLALAAAAVLVAVILKFVLPLGNPVANSPGTDFSAEGDRSETFSTDTVESLPVSISFPDTEDSDTDFAGNATEDNSDDSDMIVITDEMRKLLTDGIESINIGEYNNYVESHIDEIISGIIIDPAEFHAENRSLSDFQILSPIVPIKKQGDLYYVDTDLVYYPVASNGYVICMINVVKYEGILHYTVDNWLVTEFAKYEQIPDSYILIIDYGAGEFSIPKPSIIPDSYKDNNDIQYPEKTGPTVLLDLSGRYSEPDQPTIFYPDGEAAKTPSDGN